MTNYNIERIKVSEINKKIDVVIDVFICCGSFESRCMTIASKISADKVRKSLIVYNEDLNEYVYGNVVKLSKTLNKNLCEVKIRSDNPILTSNSIQTALKHVISVKPLKYLIDITTFTHESLLILIKLLKINLKKGDIVFCIYNGASKYSLGEENENKWLSKGVADIRSVLGYAGEQELNKKTHLIILVGYEHERAISLIQAFEPNLISLGYGQPGSATDPKHQGANEHFHKLLQTTAKTYGDIQSFTFSCSDPWDVKNKISEHIEKFKDYNTVVAPMNTKISTIGAALASFENAKIQLCYSKPFMYNFKNYSEPGDDCYLFELNLIEEHKFDV